METGSSTSGAPPQIGSQLNRRFDPPMSTGHRIHTLVNGNEIFPAMLQAIAAASREICFETFIYWSGEIAQEFASALAQAARRDVEVLVLLDWWGAQKMDSDLIEQMRDAGATVRYFNPLRWWQLQRLNHRTHRKILVVDRKLAFTGGVGIAQEWRGDARSPDEWYDIHYRISGPVVREFREAFQELWAEVLQPPGPDVHVEAPAARQMNDTVAAQVLSSSPRSGSELTYRLFRHAIDTATDSIQLITAYFIPDDDTIAALIAAVQRGVTIDVMVPGPHIDSQLVRYSSKASWGKLLRAGVRIHVYQPTMLHAKVTIIDRDWVIIGSANFDNRSFSLNDEITVNVCGEDFAAKHREIFLQNCEKCQAFTYQDWRRRGLFSRCKETLSDFFRPLL